MRTAQELARYLGGASRTGRTWMARCPAHRDRTASLAIRESDTGLLVYCHAGCAQRAVIEELRRLGVWNNPPKKSDVLPSPNPVRGETGFSKSGEDRSVPVARIWNASVDPHDTLAAKYLKSRGLDLEQMLRGRVLRFHPRCPFGASQLPALIVAFRNIGDTGENGPPPAIHRIGLTPEGAKVGKMMLGPVAGCAVKLDPDENVTYGLGICEGIETGMAIRQLGWRPVWALGSAGAIKGLQPINAIEAITIFADNDPTGLTAARTCARRWHDAGREATIKANPRPGADVADELSGS